MTQDVLWMTEDYFKDNSILNENVDWRVVQPIMVMVQDKYVLPILGTNLFDEIADEIQAVNTSVLNETLLNLYVRKVIIWYVLSELAPALKYRYHNKGVMVRNSENSQPATLEEIQYTADMYKNNAEMYAQRTTNYLREHSSSYPSFFNGTITSDDITPNSNNYTSSIFLDDNCDSCKRHFYK